MAETRGESRASYVSQSQYSESTIINQDITDNELFNPPEHGHKTSIQPNKQVQFAPTLSRSHTLDQISDQSKKGLFKSKQLDLMERLVARPHKAQVFQAVNPSPRRQEAQSPIENGPKVPRPPSGKAGPIGSFRTTMFKRDYEKRQTDLKIKIHGTTGEPPKLTVGMLHKPKVVEAPAHVNQVEDNPYDSEEMQVLRELVELMGPESTQAESKSGIDNEDMFLDEDKSALRSKSEPETVITQPSVKTTTMETVDSSEWDAEAENDIDVCKVKYNDGIPIIEKIARTPPAEEEKEEERAAPSTAVASKYLDKDRVLSYKKKNKYDDTVPENDDIVHNMTRLRERLGWPTEIPRYGPGCKEKLDAMKDPPEVGEQKMGGKTIKEDDGEFVYCLPRWRKDRRARYDPYDLQVVSSNTARAEQKYWTLTATYVTRHEEGEREAVSTPCLWWLWERRLFYMIYNLPVFVKYRLLKTYKIWMKNVRLQKSFRSKAVIYKSLFVANEVLQGCLIHVRRLCEAASGSLTGEGDGESAIALVTLDRSKTLTLGEFKEAQFQQGKIALKQLEALREKIIDIVWESCATVAEMEGITQGIRPEGSKRVMIKQPPKEEEKPKMTAQMKLRNKYGDIPTPESKKKEEVPKKPFKPLYAEISEWRKILARLARFLRSVDLLVQEMLRRMVVTAVRQVLDHLVSSYNVTDEDEEKYNQWYDEQLRKELASTYFDSTESSPEPDASGHMSRASVASRASKQRSAQPLAPSDQKGPKGEDDAAGDDESDFSRQNSRAESVMSGMSSRLGTSSPVKQPKAVEKYVIPHFDFDQPEIVEGPPDPDEILEEIKRRDIVEEVTAPVFSLQLVLNINKGESQLPHRNSFSETRGSGKSSIHRAFAVQEETVIGKKTVTFTDHHQEEEDTGSEYEDEESYEEDSEEETEESREKSRNRFAYEGSKKREKEDLGKACVSLSPNEYEFKRGIKDIIVNFELTVGKFVSMLREPRLKVFYSPPSMDLKLNIDEEEEKERLELRRPWPDLDFMFGDDPEYQDLLQELASYMSMEMELVKQYSINFDQFCVMVDQARKLNVHQSMKRREWSTDEFQHVLATYTEIIKAMKKMTVMRRVSMIQVQSRGFRDSCLPFPEAIIKETHIQLPLIANKRNEDLLTIIKGALKKLDHYPNSVEDFVEHLSFLGKMTTELPALDKEFAVVNKLFTIAKMYDVHIEAENYALYQFLPQSFQQLKSTVLYCEAKKDENIRKFSRDLDSLIYSIRHRLMDLKNRVQDPDLLHIDTMSVTALETIKDLQDEVKELSLKARSYASYQERFGSSLTSTKKGLFGEDYLMLLDKQDEKSAQELQSELNEIEHDIMLRRVLWQSQEEWSKLVDEWTTTVFDVLNVQTLQKNVNRFTQTVYMLDKGLPHNEVVPQLKERVLDFKQGMPVITSLRNPSLRRRHWEEIEKLIQKSIAKDKVFTLGNLLEMNIFRHKERIQEISTTASNEATLETMLQKIIDLWQSTDFRLVPHAGRDTFIIGGADDIMAQLEESQVTIGTIRDSRYVAPIKSQVEEWERKLQVFSRTLDEWMNCQRSWWYLEQIFSTPDIQRQLPNETQLFNTVDKSWKDIMRRVEDRPNALKSAITPGTLDILQTCNQNLEKIQRNLEEYLETKRSTFPRFYFLSNDELLFIMAQSKDPNAVQPHLGKCFGNIKSLNLQVSERAQQTALVLSMTSAEGETVNMPRNLRVRGGIEHWMVGVEGGMLETVKRHLKEGLADWSSKDLKRWVLRHPGQVILTVAQIMFNKDVVRCFDADNASNGLVNVKEKMVDWLNELARVVTSNLLSHQRSSIEALLTINVHNRDIVLTMIDDEVSQKDDFDWTRQLRYEWDEQSNNCLVLQSNASFQYGYEYLGCSSRLVITPLTDRCYLTLTGALHLHLGGSPAGPAGTGKTETVKDLAKAVGKQCVVFNCSEGLDYKTLGKFFSGLAQSGSWCCFDEFNRIDVEVLSVVAQQLLTIKTAKDAQSLRFMFEGKEIKLNMTCGYFVTMNPTYAGRVELPDNLKSLFRSVAMMVPNYGMIAEIMLFSEGFMAAKSLSRKIVNLYELASRQLSQQDHYDFGMRAIKSVLVMAGHRRHQTQLKEENIDRNLTEMEESYILIHSLRDANLPKFLAEDVPLFERILDDLFPGIIPPEPDHGILERAINMAIRDNNLQQWPSQMDKIKQLYNQILVRHGVMLVGPTGGGKTTARSILQKALVLMPTILQQENQSAVNQVRKQSLFGQSRTKKGHVEVFTINPKCVKLGELYGETDPNTFEWTDGLIATAIRKFAKETIQPHGDESRPTTAASGNSQVSAPPPSATTEQEEEKKEGPHNIDWRWLVLDGPVDTLWVENLNTVLDDSKVLCLPSGERINLSTGMRLIFEVDNLTQASPATISRCAMVYTDPVDLGWKPYVRTWVSKLPREMPESGKQHLVKLFEHSIDKGLRFVHNHRRFQMIYIPDMCLVSTLCSILSAFFDFMTKHGGFGNPAHFKEQEKRDKDDAATESSDRTDRAESQSSGQSSRATSRSGLRKKRKTRVSSVKSREDLDTIAELKAEKPSSNQSSRALYLQKNPQQLVNLLGKLFTFAFTWSIGGNFKRQEDVDDDDSVSRRGTDKSSTEIDMNICSEFDSFMHEVFDIEPPLGIRLPTGNRSIYSYFIDMESGNFVPWDVLVPQTKSLIEKGAVITIAETMGVQSEHRKKREETDITSTVDIVRFSFLTGLLLLNKNPVLLTGDSGVGKSAIINYMLKQMKLEGGTEPKSGTILGNVFCYSDKHSSLLENISNLTKFGQDESKQHIDLLLGGGKPKHSTGLISTMIQFSAQTTAARLQAHIIHKLIKKGKDTLGAPKGRKCIVFVDDLNMPAPEEYGAQPPLELLRQFLEHSGFYDTKTLVWKDIFDVNIVSACGPPGGGRNPVSPRLLKHFCVFALPQPSTRSLQHIYQVQLGRFFQEGDFAQEFTELLFQLVSASIAVYYRMCSSMLPTPAKSHYTFNLRDLSKVIQGLLQANETVIVSRDNAAQLFAHEATRVFHDRLICPEDREYFYAFLADNLHDYFKVNWTKEQLMNEEVLFGDFFEGEGHARIYRSMSDRTKLGQVLEEFYMRMNYGNTRAVQHNQDIDSRANQMVFFKGAVEHITRAARVFRQPGGHMVLVGLDGTGKATTVQLASHIAQCKLFKLTLHKGYGNAEFREDLKKVFRSTGVKNHKIVFLLTDSDIVKESFLEDVNCILNSGEVPDLFDNEERDGIIVDMKHDAAQADIPDTRDAMYQFFLSRVKRNLHMVLTMSPAGGKFRQRCRMNPALINCCTIDWYDTWNDEAMLSVADVFFLNSEFIADEACDLEALKHKVGRMCVDIHKSVDKMAVRYWDEMRRYYYSTPSSYMELIRLYAKMLQENKADFLRSKNRLLGGLQKLSEANSAVGTMRDELESLGPKIVEKQQETEVLLQQLEKDKEAGEQVRKIVEEEEEIMQKETQIVQDYADECEKDLASALPALQNAIEALETLDKASISEIRVYTKPPVLVMTVMSAVCVLFQKKTDWATAKQMLGDQSFLKKLTNFDKSTVPDKVFHRLKKFSKLPEFNPEVVGNVSLACKSICMWVKAIEHYHEVYKMVKPKQRRVSEAKEALLMAQESLSQKQASLRKLQDHLDMLEKQYHDSVNERESLKQRKVTTGLRLKRASVLIDALVNEKVRWAESVKELDGKLQGIVGDTLIATAAVVYMGPFTSKYRKLLIGSWVDACREVNIPITKEFDLVKNTVSAHQVLKWQNEGLPTDNHSTENALFVKKAHKWPLFIDPQGQAFNYIREMEGSRLNIVAASDQNYMRSLETAISVGQPMLIKDVDETLDPALRPVLLHETFQRGGHLVIKLGETEIEYNENFKLYMTTSMANPHYLPAVYIQVNIINFTVTFEGLQEQLLSIVVKQEKPKLESQRSELLESIANDLHNLTAQEDKSLSLLHASGSSLLDDQDLVDTLHSSKGKAEEIYKRVEKSEETEKKLSQARKKYLPVATRGVTIYFVLADLAGIDVMYQFSLEWFQDMFTSCIGGAPSDISRRKFSSVSHVSGVIRPSSRGGLTPRGSMDLGDAKGSSESMNPSQLRKHMLDMINRLTTNIYRVVSVALFSNHQLIFSYMLCTSIMRTNSRYEDITTVGKIEEFDWQVFLHGNIMANMMDEKMLKEHDGLTSIERLEGENNPEKKRQPPKWIDSIRWKQCQHMDATIPAFHNLCRSIMTNKSQWKVFYANEEPYKLMEKPFNINDAKLPAGEKETGVTFEWHKLEKFHHLILLKVLRPETLIASITLFVQDQMDASYLSTGTFDLKEIYEESTAKTPLIFILSPGCDPAAQLLRFAKELRGSTLHLDMISLGRGQGPRAEELIKKAQILKGRWVFLQNCHLAASWMPNLQALMEKFSSSTDDLDKDFRLWLSSKPDPCFPISILQHGMKMTVEPPQGLKANMLRAFGSGGTGVVTEKKFEETDYGPLWKRLLFGLCLFNSVLHERKKYGRLGWNIAYEFNDSDLEVSMLQLQILLMEHDYIPWQAVTYLTGEVIYGGRVTDNWDHRCLRALLGRFFCEDVLSDSYSYSPDGIYKPIKNNSSFSNVVSYLESLPNYDSPELFGMTENAEKACLELKAFDIIETIITVQPRISLELMGAEKSNDEVVLEIAGDIINRLPFTVDDSHEYTPPLQSQMIPRPTLRNILFGEAVDLKDKDKEQVVKDAIKQVVGNSALMTVLRQEVDRFNNLLHIIHSSMKNLSKAVKGMIIMSEPLEDAYNALLSQKIPKRWTIAAYESCKPLGSWVQDLILRVDFFSEWGQLIVNNVEKIIKSVLMTKQKAPGADLDIESLRSLPRAFWLSGFIFPQGFLTAVQQNHARKLGISVDSLMFNYRVVKKGSDTNEMLGDLFQKLCIHDVAFTGNSPPEDGVIVFGLFLDGARWDMDTESLQDSIPGTRFSHLPEVHFEPRQISQMAEDKASGNGSDKYLYECPLYRTSARAGTLSSTGHSTNFVTAVNLPSDHPSDFWVMRGVALLCQLDN